MTRPNSLTLRRVCMMLGGILWIGISVSMMRLSGLGVDPYSCMNLGVCGFWGVGFGTWQLLMNILLLMVLFLVKRDCFGPGTVFNMVFVGYIADFICFLLRGLPPLPLPLRPALLVLGMVCMCLGGAFYMTAGLGTSPYDSVALFLKNWMSFRIARIMTDVLCVLIGIGFCRASGASIWTIVGAGTILTAFFTGPLVQFFQERLAIPVLQGRLPSKNGIAPQKLQKQVKPVTIEQGHANRT